MKNLFIKYKFLIIITGIVSLLYWFLPIYLNLPISAFVNANINDNKLIHFPAYVFNGFLYSGYTLPYLVILTLFFITWGILILLFKTVFDLAKLFKDKWYKLNSVK
jgi:hypothetical protein